MFSRIKAASRQPWDPNATDDRIIFGDRNVAVTGIVTCFTSTLDVLPRAHAAAINYIIPHEASFYERFDYTASSAVPDDDALIVAKRRILTANKMVIQRMHSHSHSSAGDAIMVGLINQLGWQGQRLGDVVGAPHVRLPPSSARSVGLHIKEQLGLRTLRMFGKPERMIANIGISAGMPGENMISPCSNLVLTRLCWARCGSQRCSATPRIWPIRAISRFSSAATIMKTPGWALSQTGSNRSFRGFSSMAAFAWPLVSEAPLAGYSHSGQRPSLQRRPVARRPRPIVAALAEG